MPVITTFKSEYPFPPPWFDSADYKIDHIDDRSLSTPERVWRHYEPWLKDAGYQLRARFRPDWTPSWDSDEFFLLFEDGQRALWASRTLDATRISDGLMVMLKRTCPVNHPDEVAIAQLFSSAPLAHDPRNHCVPLIESFCMPHDAKTTMVFPFLRPWHSPGFETVGEGVAFIDQIFEGIQFMHENHVAHGDCTRMNIMYDASSMYPAGFHPVITHLPRHWTGPQPLFTGRAKHYTRTQRPVRYYLIDFGLSTRFDPADSQRRVTPIPGGDKTAPEHQGYCWERTCDPFATDVYYLGNLIRQHVMQKFTGFEFMQELVRDMTKDVPEERPKMDEVVARFEKIHAALPWWKLRAYTSKRKAYRIVRAAKFIPYACHTASSISMRKAAVPIPSPNSDHLRNFKTS